MADGACTRSFAWGGLGFADREPRRDALAARQTEGVQFLVDPGLRDEAHRERLHPVTGVKHPGPILVLDDRADVLRSVARYLRLHFDAVVTSSTPAAAQQAIAAHRPPFLLCDYWLGGEHPPSTTLIREWRRDYPFIVRVAVMTGSDRIAAVSSEGVDAVFAKPFDLDQVTSFFTAPRPPT